MWMGSNSPQKEPCQGSTGSVIPLVVHARRTKSPVGWHPGPLWKFRDRRAANQRTFGAFTFLARMESPLPILSATMANEQERLLSSAQSSERRFRIGALVGAFCLLALVVFAAVSGQSDRKAGLFSREDVVIVIVKGDHGGSGKGRLGRGLEMVRRED